MNSIFTTGKINIKNLIFLFLFFPFFSFSSPVSDAQCRFRPSYKGDSPPDDGCAYRYEMVCSPGDEIVTDEDGFEGYVNECSSVWYPVSLLVSATESSGSDEYSSSPVNLPASVPAGESGSPAEFLEYSVGLWPLRNSSRTADLYDSYMKCLAAYPEGPVCNNAFNKLQKSSAPGVKSLHGSSDKGNFLISDEAGRVYFCRYDPLHKVYSHTRIYSPPAVYDPDVINLNFGFPDKYSAADLCGTSRYSGHEDSGVTAASVNESVKAYSDSGSGGDGIDYARMTEAVRDGVRNSVKAGEYESFRRDSGGEARAASDSLFTELDSAANDAAISSSGGVSSGKHGKASRVFDSFFGQGSSLWQSFYEKLYLPAGGSCTDFVIFNDSKYRLVIGCDRLVYIKNMLSWAMYILTFWYVFTSFTGIMRGNR